MGTGEPVVLKVKKAMEDLYNNTKNTNFLHGSRFLEKFLQEFHKLYIGGDYRFFLCTSILSIKRTISINYALYLHVIYLVRQCTINDSFLANDFLNVLQYVRILHCWGDPVRFSVKNLCQHTSDCFTRAGLR